MGAAAADRAASKVLHSSPRSALTRSTLATAALDSIASLKKTLGSEEIVAEAIRSNPKTHTL